MTAIAVPAAVPPLRDPNVVTRFRWAVIDTLTITRRNLLVWVRVPAYIMFTVIQPVMFVLLFRYVFGGASVPGVGGCQLPDAEDRRPSAAFATFRRRHRWRRAEEGRDRPAGSRSDGALGGAGSLVADTLRMFITILILVGVGASSGSGPEWLRPGVAWSC
jgi:ABC-2 type transport system permease protein/oleandomycin transport system permease protein